MRIFFSKHFSRIAVKSVWIADATISITRPICRNILLKSGSDAGTERKGMRQRKRQAHTVASVYLPLHHSAPFDEDVLT